MYLPLSDAVIITGDGKGGQTTNYLDDLQYDKARLDAPRFLVSYETLPLPPTPDFDTLMKNVAFIYDNAVVLLASLARGTAVALSRARLIADAFVYAQDHDRFYSDGRLRNAYPQGPGGYTGGYEGWEPMPDRVTWKSTEHNLDLYMAFMTVFDLTGEAAWRERALHAKQFVRAMWRACGVDRFATGTQPDRVTPNCDFAPADVNTWGLMALGRLAPMGQASIGS
jgi:hypothetical protein